VVAEVIVVAPLYVTDEEDDWPPGAASVMPPKAGTAHIIRAMTIAVIMRVLSDFIFSKNQS